MVAVLIAGGGTGGHVFPMVAVGAALCAERPDTEVVYVGTGRGIETAVVPEQGGRLELLDVLPLRGRGLGGFLKGAMRAATVLPQARKLVKSLAPDVVFSVGGYAAGPVTLAARSLGVPVTLLEPNAVPGFTNRLLMPLVARAYVAFPEMAEGRPADQVRWTGVPLRNRFVPAPYQPSERVNVLVMGGSQGALALNEALPEALAACLRDGLPVEVFHQTGRDKDAEVRARYAELGITDHVEIASFVDDVAGALGRADVVIERSGASSVAELCAVGRPGILVPYPHAADDHQRHNAESLERAGGAVCVVQSEASGERLEAELRRLIEDRALRAEMAARSADFGRPDAARAIAVDLFELASSGAADSRRSPSVDPTRTDPSSDSHQRAGVAMACQSTGEVPS
ncbi:MAG: undecaprenyldiphospho-muramoylpentapeptide beta-N-acetylglucosaminyltransferase [Deltaproteobacteria bacterium]|nr:undecaprenyldiphospho-muramoylpentapeptide beta-N-acetylglucosaminyltransferase [Deltaproteobacteria bacterium]